MYLALYKWGGEMYAVLVWEMFAMAGDGVCFLGIPNKDDSIA